ncbi:2'-5' RNA ligase family protein [Streptacidiphilus sp. EB129]|uniref:2'-5' RNA ligase family protein n=1 Tax=Streptacidiphilus sp. EB129 TaxID=3156262 RepID=UPI0035143413
MEKFIPSFRGAPWPDGSDPDAPEASTRVLHVYAVPDLAVDRELAVLVGECRAAMKGYPILPADDVFLHLTLEVVSVGTSDTVTAEQRVSLVEALLVALAKVDAFTLDLGSPLAGRNGALMDVHPDAEVDALHRVIRCAVQNTVPSDFHYPVAPVHMSLGYSFADGSSDKLQSALRRIRPSHATMTVASVQLVDVLFRQVPVGDGQQAWDLSWDHVATCRFSIPVANVDGVAC